MLKLLFISQSIDMNTIGEGVNYHACQPDVLHLRLKFKISPYPLKASLFLLKVFQNLRPQSHKSRDNLLIIDQRMANGIDEHATIPRVDTTKKIFLQWVKSENTKKKKS